MRDIALRNRSGYRGRVRLDRRHLFLRAIKHTDDAIMLMGVMAMFCCMGITTGGCPKYQAGQKNSQSLI